MAMHADFAGQNAAKDVSAEASNFSFYRKGSFERHELRNLAGLQTAEAV